MENIFFDIKKLKKLGKNSIIGKTVRIRRPEIVEIGRNTIIDDFSYISTKLEVGNFTHIAAGSRMIGGAEAKIKIGNFVNIGPNCCFVGGQNNYRGGELVGPAIPKDYGGKSEIEPIIIDDHVLIGCNVVILPGVHLPEGVSVGAFSLLKKEVYKPWTLYAGIPARELGKRDGKKIKEQAEKLLEDVEKGIL